MFIREDYKGMFDTVVEVINSGNRKVVVSGNPGIGKSWFGIYVCYRLLKATNGAATIVWESMREGGRTLFRGGEVFEGGPNDFLDVLRREPDAWRVLHRNSRLVPST